MNGEAADRREHAGRSDGSDAPADGPEEAKGARGGLDSLEALSASDSLALIDTQLRQVQRQVRVDPAVLFAVWGGAWFIGFGAAYLAHGDRVIPGWAGIAVPTTLLVGAMVWSIGYAIRTDRGVSGPSRTVSSMYACSWTLGFVCLFVANSALIRHGLSSDEAALLWSSTALLLTGVLYLAGGMLWQDKFQYTLGVWSMLCAAGAAFAGVPGNFLVQSLAGGGGFLALAAYHRLRFRRAGHVSRRATA